MTTLPPPPPHKPRNLTQSQTAEVEEGIIEESEYFLGFIFWECASVNPRDFLIIQNGEFA